ncbi:MAG TPA: hypothetical protein VHE61_17010 [Opitutaceae bacterium]|nr:hypothetical protein [Opitutaceae bacterium]
MIDVVAFNGWTKNLRLRNGTAELIVTLDVGPRILSYTRRGGFNPLKVFPDQAGGMGEPTWRSRGGHRFWVAPEDRERTYAPDNAAVDWESRGDAAVRLTPPPETTTGLQKQLDIVLAPEGAGVTIVHRVTRTAPTPVTLAPWALTVMTAGGVAVIPQPSFGEHPRDLLPNRTFILWPYTDLSDARWTLGRRYILLRQDRTRGPTKLGLAHAAGWCAYLVGGVCFVKRYRHDPSAPYPDLGCNFETFTNDRMLELESLGPLVELAPGQSTEHVEHWDLHDGVDTATAISEEAVHGLLSSLLPAVGPDAIPPHGSQGTARPTT